MEFFEFLDTFVLTYENQETKMNISVSSLGCRLNQAELQSVITVLKQNGHRIVKPEEGEVFIVNTCVVTHTSERKTRKLIYQAQRAAGEKGTVIVCGCFVQAVRKEKNILYISNDYKYLIPDIIENGFILPDDLTGTSRFAYPPATGSLRTRINLKIQDGCDSYCSYCIIPYVRGNPVSKSVPDVLDEFQHLLDSGYREFLLTGVQIGKYADAKRGLPQLIEQMLRIEGGYRLHLSSLSPRYVTNELLDLFESEKLVKHLHLSLQSGSDTVLQRMNRGYTGKQYLDIIHSLRSKIPLFNFTTDLIVGFPGETEKEFDESVSLVKEAGFSHIHTFRYSRREGTKASTMENNVPENEKKRRSTHIIELYMKQKREYYSRFENHTSTMLTEKARNGETSGFNEYYIPVALQKEKERNNFVRVRTKYDQKRLLLKGYEE